MVKPINSLFLILFLILCLKAFVMIYVISQGTIGLNPDEAQYWTWSQSLDWGYYSKPPAIAWQIWAGTKLFGNTELGIRFISVIFSFLLSLSVYGIVIAGGGKQRTAFWAGLVMAFSPLGFLSSLLATTDIGMVLFWSIACMLMASALHRFQAPNYYLLGFIIFCGALFKWPIYLFWILVLICSLSYRFLLNKHIIGGALLSALGLFPSVIWNVQHEWATFRHVTTQVLGRDTPPGYFKGNFFEFIGSQALLFSPIFFGLFLAAAWLLIKHRKAISPPFFFCGMSSILILGIYTFLSIFQKMQGNWCVFAYPTAIAFLCWYACERLRTGYIWLRAGLALSLFISAFMLSMPYIQSRGLFNSVQIPYAWNSFRHNVGWSNLSDVLVKSGYDPSTDFLFGDKYQTSSLLSFYAPTQKRAYFLNLQGTRKNQFSFWPGMENEKGKTGYFILSENEPHLKKTIAQGKEEYQKLLSSYFEKVEFLGTYPLFTSYGEMKKGALVFKGIGYNGKTIGDPKSY
jgi:4-amino-4-deoxy-L-arabinose transferase-like glycosyltransferase